ncbi:MAG: type IV pilus biogenesis protein PilM, partial [Planctomycetota bacterium]
MPNRIILEIDDLKYRVAKVSAEGKRLQLSRPVEVSVSAEDDPKARAAKLKEALQQAGLGRGECDVILSRRAIELREISLPPAPDDELPEMVRFSSRNEFASVNENWSIDFVPLTDAAEQQRIVLAAALPPQQAQDVKQLCDLAGLKPTRMLLRPFCTAQALVPANASKPVLLVHDLGNELEVSMVHGRKLFMTRTVKLPEEDAGERLQAIVREIQRSRLLTAKSVAGRAVGETLIAAAPSQREALNGLLAPLDIGPYQLIDACQVIAEDGGTLDATDAEKYVAHYGAGLGLTKRNWPEIDFGAPRKKVEKKTDFRKVAIWSSLAGCLLLAAIGTGWYLLAEQARKIANLETEFNQLKESNDDLGVEQVVGEVSLIDNWEKNNVNWLEELREVSQRLLTADETMVSYLKAELGREGPEIVFKGKLNERETNTQLKNNLAERPYQIEQRRNVMSTDSQDYPFEFEYALLLDRSAVNIAQVIGQRIRDAAAAQNPSQPKQEAAPVESASKTEQTETKSS